MSLFAELKRRNVIRVGLAYLVAGWLLIEASTVALEAFGAPGWVPKAVATLLAIGFPITLFFAWAFEVTPEGIKRESEVDHGSSISQQTAKRLDMITIVLLVAAVGLFLSEPLWRDASSAPAEIAEVSSDEPASLSLRELGIAVLPFENLSADEDNAYFAGGVHEEVLTNLSRIPDLRVISRTSMLKIAETELDVRAIGERLGVSHVLEGSVRRAGDRVRVTIQLIDAATDEHIWSENYDRTLEDIFAIQSDIALEIADKLQTTLSPETAAAIAERPTDSDEAYELYLRARENLREYRGADTFRPMIPLLERAIELDPEFLRARALLVKAYGRMVWTLSDDEGVYAEKAERELATLRERWPDALETRIAEAGYLYTIERDYEGVIALLEPVADRLSNDVDIANALSSSYKRAYRIESFVQAAERWRDLEPESPTTWLELQFAYRLAGRNEDAIRISEEAVARFPDSLAALNVLSHWRYTLGDDEGALEFIQRMRALDPDAQVARDLELRAIYRSQGIDAALERYRARRSEGMDRTETFDVWGMAKLLHHAGRPMDPIGSDIERALAFLEADNAALAERPDQGAIARFQWLTIAGLRALLGDRDAAATALSRAEEYPPSERSTEHTFRQARSVPLGLIDRREEAWALLAPNRELRGLQWGEARSDIIDLEITFGDYPPFQDHLRELGIER